MIILRRVRSALRSSERILREIEPTLTRSQREAVGLRIPAILKQIEDAWAELHAYTGNGNGSGPKEG